MEITFLQRDPDCEPLYGRGFVCEDQICVEAPDPCDPNPCGPGAEASSNGPGTTCQCTCPSGFLGDPYQKCIQVKLKAQNFESDDFPLFYRKNAFNYLLFFRENAKSMMNVH